MRWIRAVLSSIIVLAMTSAGSTGASAAPTQTQIYWGAYVNGGLYGAGAVPGDMRGVLAFESNVGKRLAVIGFGANWIANGVLQPFNPALFDNVRQHGSIPLFSWTSQGGLWSDLTNAAIASGKYDAYIHAWAQAAKAWGYPFFLKFDHEMDGWWYPWAEGSSTPGGPITNGNTPGSYVTMYRHVHDIFTQEGATNVTWVWAVNEENTTGRYPPLSQIYPGDSYVDWTGIDAYNAYAGASWQTLNQLLSGWPNPAGDPIANNYQLVQNVASTKPMMIPEFASIEDPNNPYGKAAWLRDAYLRQVINNYPAIKAVIYYNMGSDMQIETSAASLAAFKNSISLSAYPANNFATLGSGRILPSTEGVAYLTAVADTYIASDAPTSTQGGTTQWLIVETEPTRTRRAYLRFDLRSLAGRTIDQAVMQLTTGDATWGASQGTFAIKYNANNSWLEQYTSWNNQVGIWDVAPTPVGNLVSPDQPSTSYVAALPTTLISAHTGGLLSFQLDTTSPDTLLIASREAVDPVARPQLVIAYH